MKNYVIGVLSGVLGALLYSNSPQLAWYLWLLFIISTCLIAFSIDVFFGSRAEHQIRAAWVGLALFGGIGTVLQGIVWTFGS